MTTTRRLPPLNDGQIFGGGFLLRAYTICSTNSLDLVDQSLLDLMMTLMCLVQPESVPV